MSEPWVRIQIERSEGSVPREVGAWLAVSANRVIGTIGGGRLEFEVLRQARSAIENVKGVPDGLQRYPLGPSFGQCCGGVIWLSFQYLGATDVADLLTRQRDANQPAALFGGGHVGRAIARTLADLPFSLHWIDSRDEIFPSDTPPHVRCEHSHPVQSAVADLAPGSAVLIMSFSHAEDFEILQQCLLRAREKNDLPFIGLIGSKTKWATFRHRLEARGFNESDFARVTCPIGVPGIAGKQPAVIAVAVAAQLLQCFAW